jgi:hypothetical protein
VPEHALPRNRDMPPRYPTFARVPANLTCL